MQKRLKRKEYPTSNDFAKDVELVFDNAIQFNADHTPIWEDAQQLRVCRAFAYHDRAAYSLLRCRRQHSVS